MENTNELTDIEDKLIILTPTLPSRIKSMFIDSLIIIFLMFVASQILDLFNSESGTVRVIVFILILLYEPIMVSYKRTIGQKIMKIKVRDFSKIVKTGEEVNIGFFKSILRYVTKLLLGWISLITIHSNNHSRAIHDYVSNSVMTI